MHTPGATTIESLARMPGVDRAHTLKELFLATSKKQLVFVVVRADLDVSLERVRQLVRREEWR